jgi:hypothetical protein
MIIGIIVCLAFSRKDYRSFQTLPSRGSRLSAAVSRRALRFSASQRSSLLRHPLQAKPP